MLPKFTGLWRHPNFIKLWAGETVSLLGSQISLLALPLTAILMLKATSVQMGFLGVAEFAPLLLVSLFAGVWVDQLPRRRLMIGAAIGQALLLSSIPLVSLWGLLSMEYLYGVSFLIGTLSVFFAIAYQSYLPTLIQTDYLVEGNSKLEISQSLAEIAGPGIGGSLVQLLTAPFAILADAASFLVSALCLSMIRQPEPPLPPRTPKTKIWSQIGEGLRVILTNRILASFALCNSTINFSQQLIFTVFTLYVVSELHIEPILLGFILSAGSVGGLIGAVLAERVTRRFGFGFTIVATTLIGGISSLLIPLATNPLTLAIPLLIASRFLYGLVNPIYHVSQISVRQAITPNRLQGRVNASMRFLAGGVIPIGAFVGGLLGSTLGLRATMLVGAMGMLMSFLWVFFSPVRKIQDSPTALN
jgi:MFS family permease